MITLIITLGSYNLQMLVLQFNDLDTCDRAGKTIVETYNEQWNAYHPYKPHTQYVCADLNVGIHDNKG